MEYGRSRGDAAAMLPVPAPSCSAQPVDENATDLAASLGTLVLRHAEDHSVETVAAILGPSVSAVKMRNARAPGTAARPARRGIPATPGLWTGSA